LTARSRASVCSKLARKRRHWSQSKLIAGHKSTDITLSPFLLPFTLASPVDFVSKALPSRRKSTRLASRSTISGR
jgi:hypothetical protein